MLTLEMNLEDLKIWKQLIQWISSTDKNGHFLQALQYSTIRCSSLDTYVLFDEVCVFYTMIFLRAEVCRRYDTDWLKQNSRALYFKIKSIIVEKSSTRRQVSSSNSLDLNLVWETQRYTFILLIWRIFDQTSPWHEYFFKETTRIKYL